MRHVIKLKEKREGRKLLNNVLGYDGNFVSLLKHPLKKCSLKHNNIL